MPGLYIHIPFCRRKCHYCDFYSVTGSGDSIKPYLDAVLAEAGQYGGAVIETVYIGGGTPSLIGGDNLALLMRGLGYIFDLSAVIEATIEINPDTASRPLFETALECCVDRVSIGVQSLNDNELIKSGRLHTARQAVDALKLARDAGISNISADVIIGLPGQSWDSLSVTLSELMDCGIKHLSAYCLSIEEGTALAMNVPDDLPDDDVQAELYERACEFMRTHGFVHYEVSNFCKPGFQCRHNLNYWHEGEYIGLGAAAASHIGGCRYKNAADVAAYLAAPTGIRTDSEWLEPETKAGEEAILRLRLLNEGVSPAELQSKYGQAAKGVINNLEELACRGKLIRRSSRYVLPQSMVMMSNPILAQVLC